MRPNLLAVLVFTTLSWTLVLGRSHAAQEETAVTSESPAAAPTEPSRQAERVVGAPTAQEAPSAQTSDRAEAAKPFDALASARPADAPAPAKPVPGPHPGEAPAYREVHYDFYFITGRKGLSEEAMRAYTGELEQELQFQFSKVQAAEGVRVVLHPQFRVLGKSEGVTAGDLGVKKGENAIIVMTQGDVGREVVSVLSAANIEPLAYFLLDVKNPGELRYGSGTKMVTSYAGDKGGEVQLLPDPESKYRNIIFHNHPEVDLAGDPNTRVVVRGNQYTAILQLANDRENPLSVPTAA